MDDVQKIQRIIIFILLLFLCFSGKCFADNGTIEIMAEDDKIKNVPIASYIGISINSNQVEGEQFQILTIKEVEKIRDDIKRIEKYITTFVKIDPIVCEKSCQNIPDEFCFDYYRKDACTAYSLQEEMKGD